MSLRELTYELDENPAAPEIVGWTAVTREVQRFGTGCAPIAADALAEIERRALQAEVKREIAELRVKLLERLMLTMVAALSSGPSA